MVIEILFNYVTLFPITQWFCQLSLKLIIINSDQFLIKYTNVKLYIKSLFFEKDYS